MKTELKTFLMFDGNAEEAMRFYFTLFKNAEIGSIIRYKENELGKEGTIMSATFALNGHEFMCIDSPIKHEFTFTPAISIYVTCSSEEEIDTLFLNLSNEGKVLMPLSSYGFSDRYAWLEDKFGVSWQLNYEKK